MLNLYETGLLAALDLELRGRLGPDLKDLKTIKILSKTLRISETKLTFGADVNATAATAIFSPAPLRATAAPLY